MRREPAPQRAIEGARRRGVRRHRTLKIAAETGHDDGGLHRDCAVAVDAMCKPVREKAMAQWTDSTEGRVCVAARNIAQWVRKPSEDHEKFGAGWK